MGVTKEHALPLEEALKLAGHGLYTKYIIFAVGFALFGAIANMQMLAVVMPVASCDLNLTNYEKGFLMSVPFTGITLSSHLFGFLADMCGRRKIMLICTFTAAVVSFISSLSPNFITLVCCWFVIGFMTGGIFTPGYVYVSEFCPKEIRARGVLIASAMSALATGYLPCIASLIVPLKIQIPLLGNLIFTSWRLFIALFPITNLIPMILMYSLPESPKYVLNEGRESETLEILQRVYSVNNRAPMKNYPVERICLDSFDELSQRHNNESSYSILTMFKTVFVQTGSLFSQRFIVYTTISSLMMMGILGMYNTFVLWLPQQAKLLMLHSSTHSCFNATMCDIMSHAKDMEQVEGSCNLKLQAFLPSITIGVAQSLTFLFVSSFADKVEKKYIVAIMTGLSALASFSLEYVHEFNLIIICLGLTIVLLLTSYPVTLSIAVEFFPTSMRSTAASIILLCGRLAAVLGSQVFGFLFHEHCSTAYWVAGAILLGVSVISAASPTKRKEQDNTTM